MSAYTSAVRHGGAWLPAIGLAALGSTAVTLAVPDVLGSAVDAAAAGHGVGRQLLLAGALMTFGVLCDMTNGYASAACVAGTTAWLRLRMTRRVLDAGPANTGGFTAGDLLGRVCGNAADAGRAGPGAVSAVTGIAPPVGSLVLLAVIDPWLAVAFLAGTVGVILVLRSFTRGTTRALRTYLEIQGRIVGRLVESLGGIRTIAAAGTAAAERDRILAELPELHAAGRATWRFLARSTFQGSVLGPATLAAVLAVGGLELAKGRITPGELFAASRYASIGTGLGGLTAVFAAVARSRTGASRAAELLELTEVEYGDRAVPEGTGELTFLGVSCGMLRDVDLTVPGGAAVAVVGPSGSGKSVLATLAARLRDPDEGEVLLDGVRLPEIAHDGLRAAVGCAFERPTLVGTTVADAIGPHLSRSRVEDSAKAARADAFVRLLPEGYDTPLADAPMSGGEAQRIGLARAWPAHRLLVLDDATSSLDTATEALISEALLGGARGRTRLIVTHRAATAARADLVVWLDEGRVRRVGGHDWLWQDAAYREVFAA
ncbi:ABC transporter ATP-binding protein [Catenulispora rubra]|uniref:ABC transporter ATP-binding protein n=1 Tax=Catenulispora rubra TaxID=280293 RepID=UPI0018928796|nr:ABC transporter ATP-binding protein [Catenulispora rubra]